MTEARRLLKGGSRKQALKLMFDAGFRCAWSYQEERVRNLYEAMKKVDLTRNPQIASARATESGFNRTPSDELVMRTADAVKSWKAAHSRGQQIKEETASKRAAWLPAAKEEFEKLRQKHPTWGRQRLAKLVASKIAVSYKSVLRHLPK
ncbi:MAG TPA: hypothetical protein VKX49_18145 [Bryobacteraceae bacterium]|nr:hypothetical protein [Bryobacteraceae bacterium]